MTAATDPVDPTGRTAPAASRCSDAARERGDTMVGTAPPARRWFLVEQNGDWGRNAWEGLDCYDQAKEELRTRLEAAGARLMLIRRPGARPEPGHPSRRFCLVDTDQPFPMLWGTARSDGDLVCAAESFRDWPAGAGTGVSAGTDAGAGTGASAAPDGAPGIVMVCTHGLKDVCCAVRGRPVAAALAAEWPDAVWECTHTGGDRFAANVVLLPDGAIYGGTDPETAVADLRAHLAGTVDPTRLRGRCGLTPPAQASVAAALRELGPMRWGDVAVFRQSGTEEGWQVELTVRGETVQATGRTVTTEPHRLTCRAAGPAPMRLPVVESLRAG
ncbi:sucrase ferredoxin [Kytococcus sedentarius]|uniref:sucrase ferredoxin n=1 Tax=Kytococcus sedentarius TaxID=1276 RepID=UPI0035BC5B3A